METRPLRVVRPRLGIQDGARWFFIVLLCTYSALANADNLDSPIHIITHSGVDARSLSRTQLRQIFTGHQQYWPDGNKITVVVLGNDHRVHQSFCKDVLNMFPYQLERLWNQLTYSGQGEAPLRVFSIESMQQAVAATPGAIGYSPNRDIPDTKQLWLEAL